MMEERVDKNVAFVVAIVQSAIQEKGVELSTLAFMLPLLLDDSMVAMINDNHRSYNIEAMVSTKKIVLANYNDRYLYSITLLYQALALLLDVKAISINSGVVEKGPVACLSDMEKECKCVKLSDTCFAARRLLAMLEHSNMVKLYKLLKVEI